MSKTKLALDVVQDLKNLAGSMEALISAMESPTTEKVAKYQESEPKRSKEAKQETKTKLPTLEDVRAKLAALSQDGKQIQVKELITGFGAKKLSDISAEKYPDLLEEADKL